MTISLRLNEKEERQLEEIKQATGLSTSTLFKKALFNNNENRYINKNMMIDLGEISTNINHLDKAIEYEDLETAAEKIKIIKKGLMEIWQLL